MVGLVGMGVMGQSLSLNLADHGWQVVALDRDVDKARRFAREHSDDPFPAGGGLQVVDDAAGLSAAMPRPRRIILLVPAGGPTDGAISAQVDHLDADDVLIDCGNAYWRDTERRQEELANEGIRFLGSGISGGEVGARFGPSLMLGGDAQAWSLVEAMWMGVAAKVDPATGRPIEGAEAGRPIDRAGAEPCAARVGPGGSGHYVKMVHNGIEYADMQLICEAYDLLRRGAGMEPEVIAGLFEEWNRGPLESYLVQITADILRQKDARTGRAFVDIVLDEAGQKGTGRWTGIEALERGSAAPSIAEAVFARIVSAIGDERRRAAQRLTGPGRRFEGSTDSLASDVRDALYCAKICAYAQGLALISRASREQGWGVDPGVLARIWRGGCIIRARLLHEIAAGLGAEPDLDNLLLAPALGGVVVERQEGWRRVVGLSASLGIPTPGLSSALAYFDAYRSERLPAALLQAQRDYFGAHTYRRIDQPRERSFHLDWPDPDRPEREV